MEVRPFPLDDETSASLTKRFWEAEEGREPEAFWLVTGKDSWGHIAVVRQVGDAWCDWQLYGVGSIDGTSNLPMFFPCAESGTRGGGNFGYLKDTSKRDIDAEGSCKWDGCRETRVDSHQCDDESFAELMAAISETVKMALKLAGHEMN